ncbi:MAG: DNA-directed RNA polymerase subunit alpha C-terminal domain-containing protein [Phycisphaerae bacterium]
MSANIDVNALFQQTSWDRATLHSLQRAAFATADSVENFKSLTRQLETSGAGDPKDLALKLGLCHLLLGHHREAADHLAKAKPGALRDLAIGRALRELGRFADSCAAFEQSAGHGGDALECACELAESRILNGEVDAAADLLKRHASAGASNALWHSAHGRLLDYTGKTDAARTAFEKAVELAADDGRHVFRLAFHCDLHGDDERAVDLYEQCAQLPIVRVNALMNLAVLHEDAGEYDAASDCLQRVLAVEPNHARALMFLKDVEASEHMVIDEDQEREAERRNAILDIPITEFELSVRARNCLKKMNLRTLGDLLRISEAELLSYKNFGETSLNEIKAMLAQKGLRLGQFADELGTRPRPDASHPAVAGANPEALARPVAELELSVRSRKCLQRLNIASIGELCMRTEQELLSTRNFGQTSLNEIKRRLGEMGLRLRKPGE